jgi:hypothetical protein
VSGRCTVCSHEAIDDINRALVSGTKQVALCDRYGLSKFAVSRHYISHLPKLLVKAHEAEEAVKADDLLGLISEQQATARRIAKDAERGGERRTVLLAVRELLRIVELQAKLAGALQDNPQVNIVLAPAWLEVRSAMLVALSPFPDARAAVAASLLELEAGDS